MSAVFWNAKVISALVREVVNWSFEICFSWRNACGWLNLHVYRTRFNAWTLYRIDQTRPGFCNTRLFYVKTLFWFHTKDLFKQKWEFPIINLTILVANLVFIRVIKFFKLLQIWPKLFLVVTILINDWVGKYFFRISFLKIQWD